MKIALDVFGCDNGPEIILDGCLRAMRSQPDLQIVLCGDSGIMLPILQKAGADLSRIEILDAKEVITNNESPTDAIKQKKNSSMLVGIEALRDREDITGMVSCGSTGALLSCGVLKLGRTNGVLRPALTPVFPTLDGKQVCLLDCGANVDCKPEYLVQFAYMGAAYMRCMYGVENPRVALVSVGVEDKKGNELTKEVFARLKESDLNFVGNMEAREAMSGDYDVLVCDGFVGNVLLKTVEGTALLIMSSLKKSIMASKSAKIGSIFMKKAFKNLKQSMDYQAMGGAPLLGVKKVLIKGHGSSKASAVEAALLQAYRMAKSGLSESLKNTFKKDTQINLP